jgi:integrase
MAVRKRGSRYVVDYYPQGRKGKRARVTLPESVRDEDQAKAIEVLMKKAAKGADEIALPAGATVERLFPDYLDWYGIHRAEGTHYDLERIWERHLKRILGKELLEELNDHHINLYKKLRKAEHHFKKKKEPISNRTINKELSYFSGFLRWCRKKEGLRLRPIEIEALPAKRPTPIPLTFGEAVRIIEAAEETYRIYFLCLFTLGLRKAEARWLKPEDFDLANRTVRVKQKGGSWKTLPLNGWLFSHLEKAEAMARLGQYLFLNRKTGRPVLNIRKALARAVTRAGVEKKVNPHLLRHSIATILMGEDVNMRLIQNYLGHSKVSTTEFYTHVATEHLRGAAAVVDRNLKAFRRDYTNNNKINDLNEE